MSSEDSNFDIEGLTFTLKVIVILINSDNTEQMGTTLYSPCSKHDIAISW